MKSDIVLVIAIICLSLLGIVSSFAFTEATAKILVGSAIGVIAAICGVQGVFAIKALILNKQEKDE